MGWDEEQGRAWTSRNIYHTTYGVQTAVVRLATDDKVCINHNNNGCNLLCETVVNGRVVKLNGVNSAVQ